MKIISATTCPVGEAAGHDGDECRANLLEDHSVFCVTCRATYPKMSARMRRVYRAIACHYGTPSIQLGSNTEAGSTAYDAACLSGYDPNLSDRVCAKFTSHDGESVTLQYEQSNEAELDNADLSIGRALTQAELTLLSACMKNCVAALESEGFRVRHVGNELGLRVVLSSGRQVGSMGFVLGANVELNSRR